MRRTGFNSRLCALLVGVTAGMMLQAATFDSPDGKAHTYVGTLLSRQAIRTITAVPQRSY